MTAREDHFSAIANEYSRGRFGYPEELFDYLGGLCHQRTVAWDCATGSGQAVPSLAKRFERVVATDISESLLQQAPAIENVTYRCAPAEMSGVPDASTDLVTVAQALHWFCGEPFWREVERVCKPGGVFAFWGYIWPSVDAQVDGIFSRLREKLAGYWPERSRLIHDGYADVRPPFEPISSPGFSLSAEWRRADYIAHIRSWSAVRYYAEQNARDIVDPFDADLSRLWSDEKVKAVRWSMILRVYRVK